MMRIRTGRVLGLLAVSLAGCGGTADDGGGGVASSGGPDANGSNETEQLSEGDKALRFAAPPCLRTIHHLDDFTTPELVRCHERAVVELVITGVLEEEALPTLAAEASALAMVSTKEDASNVGDIAAALDHLLTTARTQPQATNWRRRTSGTAPLSLTATSAPIIRNLVIAMMLNPIVCPVVFQMRNGSDQGGFRWELSTSVRGTRATSTRDRADCSHR